MRVKEAFVEAHSGEHISFLLISSQILALHVKYTYVLSEEQQKLFCVNHVLLFHCVKRSISVYLLLLNSFYLLFQSTVLKCGKSCLFCVAEQC